MSSIWHRRPSLEFLNRLHIDTAGVVTGTARPAHLGRGGHLWEIDIVDEAGRMLCLARLTTSVIPRG